MKRLSPLLRSLVLVSGVSLATVTGFTGCTTIPDPATSSFREREANWGSQYRSTNKLDKGTGLNPKGREVERSLGYQ